MKHIIQQVFSSILENPVFDLSLIEKYFSKDYVQFVDHKQLNYEEFILHIQKLKEKVTEQKIDILNYAENGNIIFTHHIAKSALKDGSIVRHKVLAEFTIQDDKIVRCDELTLLLEGSPTEKNLGSEI
ncbi:MULTISPECIES: limonene-1,2-epoxide hydrolase family protein [Chryseobacterium]|uniref:Nuclear transport factor 2 family protein n=1 Tax=Chryseobacterium indologenes TaxID=253 RepID=A0AAD0YSA2_CHRID|nr:MULTISPECIES: limonene-1,2-epoxide hydrolase family protein [Chryseobacterium]ASE60776.1 nuclear transport factor 2 family protein [Chryseobacterium indologenes]ATN04865.1 nuclear transport factor 2 family protein [Chryseobacterium indologenes]AYY86383.1 nuclear transport factor 2 family protein [Chryseobacterium indologenes]AZB16475.1 nuclear transport factor 2 family protein [Chryseobacterium indologenes]QIX83289.1 nuclear transport factor 2 family protein [Chryseobacterium indologenes]